LLELDSMLGTDARDAREVDLEERADVRRGVARHHHVLADQLPHLRHGLDAVTGPRLGERARMHGGLSTRRTGRGLWPGLEILEQIALGDAAGDAASLQRAQLDAMVGGHAAHEGGGFGAEALFER